VLWLIFFAYYMQEGGMEVGRAVAELQRLKRERRELINSTQSNIETNHLAYQEKMKRVQDLLLAFARTSEDGERNIVSPLKPIPQPFHQSQEGRSSEVLVG
jgi:hypothetical protein